MLMRNLLLLIFFIALIFFGFNAFSNKSKKSTRFGELISAIFGSLLVSYSFIHIYSEATALNKRFNFEWRIIFLVVVGSFGLWLIIRNFFKKSSENKNFVKQKDMTELKTFSQTSNDNKLQKGKLWVVTILSIILPSLIALPLSYVIFSGEKWGRPIMMLPWLILYAVIAGLFFGKKIKAKSLIAFVLFYVLLAVFTYYMVWGLPSFFKVLYYRLIIDV